MNALGLAATVIGIVDHVAFAIKQIDSARQTVSEFKTELEVLRKNLEHQRILIPSDNLGEKREGSSLFTREARMLSPLLECPADFELRLWISKHSLSMDMMVHAFPRFLIASASLYTTYPARLGDKDPAILMILGYLNQNSSLFRKHCTVLKES